MNESALWASLQRIERNQENHSALLQSLVTERAVAAEKMAALETRLVKVEKSKWSATVSFARDLLVIGSVIAMAGKSLGF